MGYHVVGIVSSSAAALQQTETTHPHLVLMDIQLKGDMDGIEAARLIRSRFNIPVIYLTSHADINTIQRAKVTEPFGFITKPFHERDLRTSIEVAIYKHQMEQKLAEREQWLSTTLKSIGDAVIATDGDSAIIFMNPVAEQLTGWTQAEATGQELSTIFRIVDEDTDVLLPDLAKQVMKTGRQVCGRQPYLSHFPKSNPNFDFPIGCSD